MQVRARIVNSCENGLLYFKEIEFNFFTEMNSSRSKKNLYVLVFELLRWFSDVCHFPCGVKHIGENIYIVGFF